MTVTELIRKIKTKALAYGIKQELLNDDIFVEEIRKASNEFTIRTKVNLMQSSTTTVTDQEYYTLPAGIITPIHLELGDFPINHQSLVDLWLNKRDVGNT